MSDVRLRTLTIRDFRSIRGTAVVPLEAPVVLLHGTNGAGKSTVMSALELALTGSVTGIDPVDPSHLVHRGADRARIDLVTSDRNIAFAIQGSAIGGDPLLGPEDARFFVERCYLQQRTLGRLLELYQETDGDESALTAFVNELLGLDELDALIAGLYPVLHKARLKRLVPGYADAERMQSDRDDQILALNAEMRDGENTVAETRAELSALLAELEAPPALEGDADAASVWLNEVQAAEERALIDLLAARRELAALAKRAGALAQRPGAADLAALEQAAADARAAADHWRAVHGAPLESLLDELRERLPAIPAAAGAGDPGAVGTAALQQVTAELDRLDSALQVDELARKEAERLERTIGEARARLEGIREQLSASPPPTAAEELANALAALIPHVHAEDCPVCGRDYSEVGAEPLAAHLALRVSELSARAKQLQELTQASSEALADLNGAVDQRDATLRQRMEPETKVAAQASRALLADAQQRLRELTPGVADGSGLLRVQTEAERDLAVARERDTAVTDLRRAIEAQAAAMGQSAPAAATSATDAITALSAYVTTRIDTLERRSVKRAQAAEAIEVVGEALSAQGDRVHELAELEAERDRAAAAIAELDRRRKVMRTLHDEAERARTQTVQRVFTNSLNRAWRDLFVRLAPEEPFVPAFRMPDPGERVVGTLETVHRDGKPGGPPAAMLSAGNLNTAALTLFLALNLSVERRLPWILLDDPVQSMDGVHVAQFAALLRTLTREHGRRVMIAVHERALFDYLALELSPATKDEALQTIELTRGPDGATASEPDYQGYVEDRALEPA